MENFGIEEDIEGLTDTQINTDRKSGQSSPHKEISGAVDMQALNNNLETSPVKKEDEVQEEIEDNYVDEDFEQNKPSESVDNDIKEDIGNNNFDFEPEKPVAANQPQTSSMPPPQEEDNEDLFGGPEPEVTKKDSPKESQNEDIKDEYDFDIPNDIGNQSEEDEPKSVEKAESHRSEAKPKIKEKSESEKIPSEIHESEKIDDEIQDDYDIKEASEDQGAAKQPSVDEKEKSEEDYEMDDFDQKDSVKQNIENVQKEPFKDKDDPDDEYSMPDDKDPTEKDLTEKDVQSEKYIDEQITEGKDDNQPSEDEKSDQNIEKESEKVTEKLKDNDKEDQVPDQNQSSGPGSPSSQSQQKDDQNDEKAAKKKKHLRFDQLSDQALYILYTMTIYIGENEPEDLFNDFIYEQLIKTRRNQNMVELIGANDFFNVLEEHEVISKPQTSAKIKELELAKDSI